MSTQSRFMRWFLAAFTLAFVSACVQEWAAPNKGKVAVTIQWPAKAGYHLAAIPLDTVRVEVEIFGEGLSAPMTLSLERGSTETSTKYFEVPIGPKVVRARSLNAEGVQTASGEDVVIVEPNALTDAHVELLPPIAVVPSPSPTPPLPIPSDPLTSPTPAPSPSPVGTITTVAGNGVKATIDSPDALRAGFNNPRALAYDAKGLVLYVADNDWRLIRRIDLVSGAVTTVAVLSTVPGPSDVVPPGTNPNVSMAASLAIGPDGLLYFTDRSSHLIRKILRDGSILTVAGSGVAGFRDGESRVAQFNYPTDLVFDADGDLYVADLYNHRIRHITPNGIVTTVAGSGAQGSTGDGGSALEATLSFPGSVALDPVSGALYVAELSGRRVRSISLGVIETVAGDGIEGVEGEGGPAKAARLSLPLDLAVTPQGELLIADGWVLYSQGIGLQLTGRTSRVVKLTTDGRLVPVTGLSRGSAQGFSGDDGDAALAELNNPSALAVAPNGTLYIADTGNHRIRAVRWPQLTPSPSPTPAPGVTVDPAASGGVAP